MGHYCWHLHPLPSLFPRRLFPRTEKNEKGIGASRISQSMPIRQCFAQIGNNSPSGSSLGANAHDSNHLLRMICPSTVRKTAMQCTAMHLLLQVCLTPFFKNPPHSDRPCPAYNPDGDNVPAYTPPEGASKANPAQSYAEIPPPGPPPSHSEEGPSSKWPVVTVTPPEASSSSDPR